MSYRAPKYCPKCDSNKDVIPISYGKPTPKGFKESDEGKIKLGGCIIYANSPKWYCKKDDIEFR
ncbi:hypothetical protein [Croceibacter atlanticus]|uniref:hypothetical protein n=1 Tax=Croceibacter atlanticus TaxID=313588 RepID=UPI000E9DBDB6|nr:hypothetical protein [Flavobacteriaceae bacterium]|tara:strand:- start:452 stop:643 length:192 start_codon:yes stop_codon:yes gene_type:complete